MRGCAIPEGSTSVTVFLKPSGVCVCVRACVRACVCVCVCVRARACVLHVGFRGLSELCESYVRVIGVLSVPLFTGVICHTYLRTHDTRT
jgi:hypothetical protein